jgi:antitoxin PrlF
MVEIATVTSKGQVTLPASIRRKLRLRKGSKLIFLEEGGEVRLLTGEDLEKRFAVFERRAKETGLTPRRLSALVKEARDRLWREHYADRD